MATSSSFVTPLVVSCAVIAGLLRMADADCYMVPTSEGTRDMKEGEYACSPSYGFAPLGKYYFQCSSGMIFYGLCSGTLRWDNEKKVCNWPKFMNCGTAKPTPKAAATTTSKTTTPDPSCNKENCQLPDCFCYGGTPDMEKESIPQFIMLSFDDGVTPHVFFNVYLPLLVQNKWELYNPNQCPIKGAFFVSHWHTNYNLVKYLHQQGHEINSHSVNHQTEFIDTKESVKYEITGIRDFLEDYTGIPGSEIKGFRAPYLRIYDDIQFEVMAEQNFTYDSSITNIEMAAGRPPLWPFTLDYTIADDRCPNKPCPAKEHPGIWEVPLNGWIGNDTFSCPMIDGCKINQYSEMGTEDDYYYYFKSNFERFYEHKVPMHMFTHASMFLKSHWALKGLQRFLSDIMEEHDDVWLVTPSQVIDWMQNPVNATEILTDSRFGC